MKSIFASSCSSSEIALAELLTMASLRLLVAFAAAGAHAFVPVAPDFRVQRPASRGLEYLDAGAAPPASSPPAR